MKKKGLLVVVALLAIASLMAAMAYSTAVVANKTTTQIVSTDEALLAVVENPEFIDFASIGKDGNMAIDITKGFDGAPSGLQPGSTYNFRNLFYVKNNTNHPIRMGASFLNNVLPDGLYSVSVAGKNVNETEVLHLYAGQQTGFDQGKFVVLQAGDQVGVNWCFTGIGNMTETAKNVTFQVRGQGLTLDGSAKR